MRFYNPDSEVGPEPRRIELLAPARDLACGRAAVGCGADAVYIGAEKYGARAQAGNSLKDIEELVKFAHKYRVRIYATVNTILNDRELEEACGLIHRLHACGVDAVIAQDMGLLECELPPIPLFASTQAHNNSPQKVLFLEQVGFKRVILARELTLTQIREIRSRTTVELECFIHGALCVCYSGQCYLSLAIGGRSANRGECAQPCRKMYSLEDSSGETIIGNKHLLSLRDLNRSDDLPALIDAGISSFKIEGRLKDELYVKNVVGHYRRCLDAILQKKGLTKSSCGKVILGFEPDLEKTFNRGYTSYYLEEKHDRAAAPDSPKFVGTPAGRATPLAPKSCRVEGGPAFHPGDGIAFFDRTGVLQGTLVNRVADSILHLSEPVDMIPDTPIFRNHDHEFARKLQSAETERWIDVFITVRAENSLLKISVRDEEGEEILLEEDISHCERANNPQKARETICIQLSKLGGTEFHAESVRTEVAAPPFLPVSRWNELRRRLIADLVRRRQRNYIRFQAALAPTDFPHPEKTVDYRANILNAKAKVFYERHGVQVLEFAAESGIDLHGRTVMATPFCLRLQYNLCPRQNPEVDSADPLWLVDERGIRHLLNFDCAACEMQIIYDPKTGMQSNPGQESLLPKREPFP